MQEHIDQVHGPARGRVHPRHRTEREEIGRAILRPPLPRLRRHHDGDEFRAVNGEEPPAPVAAAMAAANVVLCPTTKSLTHTQARKAAAAAGARIATMPGVTMDMLHEGAMTADYEQVSALTMRVAELVDSASTARISYKGHDLTMSLAGRKAIPSTGRFLSPGESGNLPSGEAYVARWKGPPRRASWTLRGRLRQAQRPLLVRIKGGRAVAFEGVDAAPSRPC